MSEGASCRVLPRLTSVIGIIVLTEGIFISGIWFTFRCNTTERLIYWCTNLALGVISIVILLNPRFRGARWRTFRMGTFVLTGGSGAMPIIHGFIIFGGSQMVKLGVYFYLGEGLLLLSGVALYGVSFACLVPLVRSIANP